MFVLRHLFPAWFSAQAFDLWTRQYIQEKRAEKGFWDNLDLFMCKALLYCVSLCATVLGYFTLVVMFAAAPPIHFTLLLASIVLLWVLVPMVGFLYRCLIIAGDYLMQRAEDWLYEHRFLR